MMRVDFTGKHLIIAMVVVAMVVMAFFVQALAGLNARPVVFSDPPAFVERYAIETHQFLPSSSVKAPESDGEDGDVAILGKLTSEFAEEKALMHKVFFDGESADVLLSRFAHPQKAKRVKMASAFSAVNVEFTHDEASGFPKVRDQFWLDVEKQVPHIQNALFEALITSAE